jgi:hypothetical protein
MKIRHHPDIPAYGILIVKTFFITISATLTAVSLAAFLFLNAILGMFGLAATAVEAL